MFECWPQDSNERLAYEQLEREGLGLANLEVWIRTEVCNPEALHDERPRLERLTSRVEEIDGVSGTFSAADLLDAADLQLYRLMARGMSRREALAVSDGAGKRFDLLERMWSSHGGLRLTVLVQTADTPQEIERQQQEILAAARAVYPRQPDRDHGPLRPAHQHARCADGDTHLEPLYHPCHCLWALSPVLSLTGPGARRNDGKHAPGGLGARHDGLARRLARRGDDHDGERGLRPRRG